MRDMAEQIRVLFEARIQPSTMPRGADEVWDVAAATSRRVRNRRSVLRSAAAVAAVALAVGIVWLAAWQGQDSASVTAGGDESAVWVLPGLGVPTVQTTDPVGTGTPGLLDVWRRGDSYVAVGRTELGETTLLDVFPPGAERGPEVNGLMVARRDETDGSAVVVGGKESLCQRVRCRRRSRPRRRRPGADWKLIRSGPDTSPFGAVRASSTTLVYATGERVTTVDVADDPIEIGMVLRCADALSPAWTEQPFSILVTWRSSSLPVLMRLSHRLNRLLKPNEDKRKDRAARQPKPLILRRYRAAAMWAEIALSVCCARSHRRDMSNDYFVLLNNHGREPAISTRTAFSGRTLGSRRTDQQGTDP